MEKKKEKERVSANVRVTTLRCYHPCWKFRSSIKLPESLHHRILLVSAGTSDAAYTERAKNTTLAKSEFYSHLASWRVVIYTPAMPVCRSNTSLFCCLVIVMCVSWFAFVHTLNLS
jgi:hypothetical protein